MRRVFAFLALAAAPAAALLAPRALLQPRAAPTQSSWRSSPPVQRSWRAASRAPRASVITSAFAADARAGALIAACAGAATAAERTTRWGASLTGALMGARTRARICAHIA